MTAPDGTKPTAMQANRSLRVLRLAQAAVRRMAAFNTVLIPQPSAVCRESTASRIWRCSSSQVPSYVPAERMHAVGSDHSYCRFGRRTPWIVSGSVLAAICMAILSACDFLPWAVFWLATQAAYAMVAIACRRVRRTCLIKSRPRRFVDGKVGWRWPAGRRRRGCCADAACGGWRRLGWHYGFQGCWFAGWLVVAAVVTLLVLPFEGASSYLPRRDVEKGDFFALPSAAERAEVFCGIRGPHVRRCGHSRNRRISAVSGAEYRRQYR